MLHKFNILNFPFENLLSWLPVSLSELSAIVMLVFFMLFAFLEFRFPKAAAPLKALRQSYRANIRLFVFNSTVLSLLPIPSLIILADHYANQGLLVKIIPSSFWKTVLAFLLLDLILYLWHKASHRFDFLWEYHKVHHCDPELNVSTSFRTHIIELIIIIAIKAAFIISLGVDKTTVIAFETIITLFVMFHHTNISFPGERLMGRVFIVPFLHRVHHSKRREEHDQNYGSVLSIWDWLFGTLAKLEPEAIGIKGNPPLDFTDLVKFGFLPGGQMPALEPNLEAMIADAAYYKSLNRGQGQNRDLDDWLQAEQEIIASMNHHESPKIDFMKWINSFRIRFRKTPRCVFQH